MTFFYSLEAERQLSKLDKTVQKRIKKYLNEVEKLENPRLRGKGLTSNLSGLWRYRVGDYRIICKIADEQLIIFVVAVAHRKEIYAK